MTVVDKVQQTPLPYYYHPGESADAGVCPETSARFLRAAKQHRRALKAGVAQYASLIDKITFYTKADLAAALDKGIAWLQPRLSAPYTLLADKLPDVLEKPPTKPFDAKSTDWLIKLAIAKLPPPAHVVNVLNASSVYKKAMTTFVVLDDGVYSGTQITETIGVILRHIKSNLTLHMVVLYYTQKAVDKIMATLSKKGKEVVQVDRHDDHIHWSLTSNRNIYLYTGGTKMESTMDVIHRLFPREADACAQYLVQLSYDKKDGKIVYEPLEFDEDEDEEYPPPAAALTIFEHKVPDYMSLPSFIGQYFRAAMADHYAYNPPYKKVAVEGGSRSRRYKNPKK